MMSTIASLLASFSLIWVDPYSETPYLPNAFPEGGIETNQVSLAAAIGEIETVSFSVCPKRDMSKVDFIPSELVSKEGNKIPASAADFALVKVWFRAGNRWLTSWSGNMGKPELINDLVLHDDGLIKVDEVNTNLFLRVDYPEPVGSRYIDIRHKGRDSRFDHDLHPVRDAKTFVPFDLKKGRYQQYWLTYRIPGDTKPGIYKGSLAVKEKGKDLGAIPLEVEVYPFSLPRARTHRDTSKDFLSYWMGSPSLGGLLAGSKRLDVAEEKMRVITRSLFEHGAVQSGGIGDFVNDSTDDLAVRSLIIQRQEGMTLKPFINGMASDRWWVAPIEAPTLSPEEHPDEYRKSLEEFKKYIDLHVKVMDKYLGHRECYFSSGDEVPTFYNRRSYGYWSYIHSKGAMTWTDSGEAEDIAGFVNINDIPAACRHSKAYEWQKADTRAVTYAGTFTGPSCPALWRRLKGFRYYYNDFDGIHEYCFFDGRQNRWNDFVWHDAYCQFGIVYWTYDGLISTLAWEGMREGIDDIRYLSLLRMRAEAAMRSSDPKVRALGKKEYMWMDSVDPEAVLNLYDFRKEVSRRIQGLIKVIGPQEPDPEMPMPPPELPKSTYGQSIAPGADHLKVAAEYQNNNRYDLAIPLLTWFYKNQSETIERRVKAAISLAKLHSYILERNKAIAVLDEMLAMREVTKVQKGQLLMQKLSSLLTDVVFEEAYSLEQIAEASKVAVALYDAPGIGEENRFKSVHRVLFAYEAGGFHEEAIKYYDDLINNPKYTIGREQQAELLLVKIDAVTSLGDLCKSPEEEEKKVKYYKEVCKLYDTAHKMANYDLATWRDRTLLKEGRIAKYLQDWKRAQRCYGDVLKVYGTNPDYEAPRKSAQRQLVEVTKKLNAQGSSFGVDNLMKADTEELGIDLDE